MGTNDASPDCPECGEPIGARASYCMHCGAEFGDEGPDQGAEDGGDGISDAIGSVMDSIDGSNDRSPDVEYDPAQMGEETSQDPTTEADAGGVDAGTVDASTTDTSTTTGSTPDVSTVETSDDATADTVDAASGATGSADASTEDKGFMHPDSLLDNTLTGVVGIGAGIVIGIVSLIVFGIAFKGAGVLLAFVAWLGSTAYLAQRRTVFDAVRDGSYGLTIVLLIAGVGVVVAAVQEPNTGITGAVGAFVPFVVFGSVVAGVGYLFGLKGVE